MDVCTISCAIDFRRMKVDVLDQLPSKLRQMVCTYVHVCTCMYVVCMYMYVCMYVFMYVYMYVCMYVCTCMYACMYVCVYVRTYVCMYVCMYVP